MEFLKQIPPEWLTIAVFVLTLVVNVAHMRGNKVPILSALLNLLAGKPVPAPAPESPDELPARWIGPLRKLIREEAQAPAPPGKAP